MSHGGVTVINQHWAWIVDIEVGTSGVLYSGGGGGILRSLRNFAIDCFFFIGIVSFEISND